MSKYLNMVVITARHGEKYIGELESEDLKRYMNSRISNGEPVELLNARSLIAKSQPIGTPSGEIVGLKNFVCITDIDMSIQPIPMLYVMPSVWYFVGHLTNIHKHLDQLFQEAEDNEKANKARSAGIHLPGRS